MRIATKFILILVLTALACSGNFAPVDIEDGDMCSLCRMAISEKQFAAEIISEDESVMKFDDIGCLLQFLKRDAGATTVAAAYVADSQTRSWLKAEDAYFIRSSTVKTPMASGIVAFSSADKAGTGALRFSELGEK